MTFLLRSVRAKNRAARVNHFSSCAGPPSTGAFQSVGPAGRSCSTAAVASRKCRPVKVGAVEHSCLPATTVLNAFLTSMAVTPLERSYSTSYRFGISSDIAAPSGNRGSYYLGFSGTIVARTVRQADMPSPAPVRVKCAQPLQDPAGIWICWALGGARAGYRIDRVFNNCAFFNRAIMADCFSPDR